MPYTAEISRGAQSCFLFLIDQSSSMADPIGGSNNKPKKEAVADAVNKLLDNLVIKCTKSEGIRDYYDVGVIGYGSTVGNAFSGRSAGDTLLPISTVANDAQIEERTRKTPDDSAALVEETYKVSVWFRPEASGGTPMCSAFSQAQSVLAGWLPSHQDSYPPIVINITDGESTDGDPSHLAETIRNLCTRDGAVLLFNIHISQYSASPIIFPDSEAALPNDAARLLFRMSSILPDNLRTTARSEGYLVGDAARGFAFNADFAQLIQFLDIGTRPSNLR
jgi:hypothetical protein